MYSASVIPHMTWEWIGLPQHHDLWVLNVLYWYLAVHCAPAAHSNNSPVLSGCVGTAEDSDPRPTELSSWMREESIAVAAAEKAVETAVEFDDMNVGKTNVMTGSLNRWCTTQYQYSSGDNEGKMRQNEMRRRLVLRLLCRWLFPVRIRSEPFPTCRNHTSRFVRGLHTCNEFATYLAFCS